MTRRFLTTAALIATLAIPGAIAQQAAPPHEWLFGSWTGGVYPALDTEGARCFAQPTLVFTRDVVLRATPTDFLYRQRLIETVAATTSGAEFRFTPLPVPGGRLPPDLAFGCTGGPNALVVERRDTNEIVMPDCAEFPFPLRRCTGP